MKYIFTLLFTWSALFSVSQEIKAQKIVLNTDYIILYNKKIPSTEFGHSYFLCLQKYSIAYSDESFKKLSENLKKYNPDIVAIKADDNKSVVCVFPKHTIRGINDFHELISNQFDPQISGQIKSKETVHIQVVPEYDPANKEEEKGFKGFN
ncbi:MAG: hypothetical protein ACXVC6_12565 [Bacteroidia bacterium]